jgi:hypothetical protein
MVAGTDTRGWGRWLLPSLTQWLWLVLLLVLLSPWWRTAMVGSDGDACFHWRVGTWMLQHREILRQDVFSHTRYGAPIISKEWLAELIFAGGGELLGFYGLCVVAALAIATTFALLHRQLLRAGNDPLVATLVVLLAAWASSGHWLARPHVFSFLMVVLWHGELLRFERSRGAARLAVTLPGLMVLWVNLHGAFLAGLLILGAYAAGAWRDRPKCRVLVAVLILCAVASLLNPSGYRLHIHNFEFLQSKFLTGWLGEYQSANFQALGPRAFLTWLALLFFTLVLRRPRVAAGQGLLLLMWTYFALYSVRNIPLLALLTAPIIAPVWSAWVRERWPAFSERMTGMLLIGRGWPVAGAVAIVAILYVPRPVQMPPDYWPVKAVEFIREHPEEFAGNMFNQYVWGGYLLAKLPEHKVFIDGRTDFYGESLVREFADTTALATNWTAALEKYDVRWSLLPADHRLNQALALAGWERLYTDPVATIYRRSP